MDTETFGHFQKIFFEISDTITHIKEIIKQILGMDFQDSKPCIDKPSILGPSSKAYHDLKDIENALLVCLDSKRKEQEEQLPTHSLLEGSFSRKDSSVEIFKSFPKLYKNMSTEIEKKISLENQQKKCQAVQISQWYEQYKMQESNKLNKNLKKNPIMKIKSLIKFNQNNIPKVVKSNMSLISKVKKLKNSLINKISKQKK